MIISYMLFCSMQIILMLWIFTFMVNTAYLNLPHIYVLNIYQLHVKNVFILFP